MKLEIINPCSECIVRAICRIPNSTRPSDCPKYYEVKNKVDALINYLHFNNRQRIWDQFEKGKVERNVNLLQYSICLPRKMQTGFRKSIKPKDKT